MLDKVQSKVDFIRLEHEILDFWKSNKIFQKLVESSKGKPKWSFLDGPITANNPMGVHHAWGRTYKDLFLRYHAMKGYELRYQNGFDCQGLWVEVEVEKELGFKSKTDIEKFGIENFVNACKERVKRFSEIQTKQSIRLGYWMDWDNSYYTMSDENNYTIWHFLKKCHEKGWIYKGHDVMPWCIDCGASLSEHEIATEGYIERTHLSVFIRLPFLDAEKESLLVWTTTPWTLTSNVAAAVHPDIDYIKVKQNDEYLYLAKRKELILKEKGSYEVIENLKGSDLAGRPYHGPFDHFEAQANVSHKIVSWTEVNDEEGTGVVHVAPGCGHEDYQLSRIENLSVIAPLDQFGNYLKGFGWLTGKNVRDVDKDIVSDLKSRGILYKREHYTHRYPICWRHKTDLVFRLVDEWFISMDEMRSGIMEITKQIHWIPGWGKDQELDWLQNMDDWMISKKRYWGLALPIYPCDKCDEVTVIGGYEELKEKAVEGWTAFEGNSPHRPWIDHVKIKCDHCGSLVSRIPDVGNPWLDAGIVPYSTIHYVTDPDYWKSWFPADFITESLPGQFRNWFYSLLAMSTVLENKPPFKKVLGHAIVKDEKGKDMHKSDGNAIWFDDAAEEMGVDVMRWMFAAQNPEKNLLFGYGSAKEIRKRLITLWNVYSFFVTYARLDRFNPVKVKVCSEDFTQLDRWITSKMNQIIVTATDAYESYRIERLMRKIDRFLDDLSNWYVRRNRRRFWKSENDSDKNAAYVTLYNVLSDLIKVLAPIIPFVTEKIYQNLIRNLNPSAAESLHLCEFPSVGIEEIDEKLISEIDSVVKIVELGRSARNKANLKIRQPLAKLQYFIVNEEKGPAILRYKDQILEELNIKELELVKSRNELIIQTLELNYALLGKRFGKDLPGIKKALDELKYDDIASRQVNNLSIELSYNGETFELRPEEIIIKEQSIEGKSTASEPGITVAISTELTEELIQEGIVRDMIRHIQNMRKEANFNVEDRIKVTTNARGIIDTALNSFKDYFCNEILAVELTGNGITGEYTKEILVRGETVSFGISRISL
ncbi:MAG: isoleucine--tRNA ligase [Candidatus Marinimicrobia bacterium]|nr:isoleucine--tRNA ligase [Candidatus Neomarinimicrobiota bacterium]